MFVLKWKCNFTLKDTNFFHKEILYTLKWFKQDNCSSNLIIIILYHTSYETPDLPISERVVKTFVKLCVVNFEILT